MNYLWKDLAILGIRGHLYSALIALSSVKSDIKVF